MPVGNDNKRDDGGVIVRHFTNGMPTNQSNVKKKINISFLEEFNKPFSRIPK
jgi:hypothetical protein